MKQLTREEAVSALAMHEAESRQIEDEDLDWDISPGDWNWDFLQQDAKARILNSPAWREDQVVKQRLREVFCAGRLVEYRNSYLDHLLSKYSLGAEVADEDRVLHPPCVSCGYRPFDEDGWMTCPVCGFYADVVDENQVTTMNPIPAIEYRERPQIKRLIADEHKNPRYFHVSESNQV